MRELWCLLPSLRGPAVPLTMEDHWSRPSILNPGGSADGGTEHIEMIVGTQSDTCMSDSNGVPLALGRRARLWISAVPRTPPSHSVCFPPRSGQLLVPVPLQYDILTHTRRSHTVGQSEVLADAGERRGSHGGQVVFGP